MWNRWVDGGGVAVAAGAKVVEYHDDDDEEAEAKRAAEVLQEIQALRRQRESYCATPSSCSAAGADALGRARARSWRESSQSEGSVRKPAFGAVDDDDEGGLSPDLRPCMPKGTLLGTFDGMQLPRGTEAADDETDSHSRSDTDTFTAAGSSAVSSAGEEAPQPSAHSSSAVPLSGALPRRMSRWPGLVVGKLPDETVGVDDELRSRAQRGSFRDLRLLFEQQGEQGRS